MGDIGVLEMALELSAEIAKNRDLQAKLRRLEHLERRVGEMESRLGLLERKEKMGL